jgi:DNA-binding MarR family transcriptional regulator
MRVYTRIYVSPAADPVRSPCVCHSLRMATRAVARMYDAALEPAGLRTTQYSILARLEADGPGSLTELGGRLLLDRTTLARELAPLEGRGLVRIERGADRRQRVVTVTDEGVALVAAARPAWREAQREVRARFGDARSRSLVAELHELAVLAAA